MAQKRKILHDVFVVDGSRSPFLKAKGKPGPFTAANLAVSTARPLLARMPFDATAIDEVILGCVMPGPDEANIARVAALRLGCDQHMPAWTVQRNCASGLQALDSAAQNIAMGRSSLVLAGGVEAMSHAPVLLANSMVAWLSQWAKAKTISARVKTLGQLKPAYLTPVIGLLRGLTDPVVGLSMGQTAEIIAHRFSIDRDAMDSYAVRSHQRLSKAIDLGYTSVKVYAAGYPAWKKAYGAGETASATKTATKVKAGDEEGSIDTATFVKMVKENPDSMMLIDVRDADEFVDGHFKTAVNIPVDQLEDKISTLPTDKPVVFVCGTGARSGESYYMVQDVRPELKNVYYLEGYLYYKKDGSFEVTKEPKS